MRWALIVVLACALAATGCSGNVGSRPPESTGSVEPTTQGPPAEPGIDAPGTPTQGRVGESASLGGWTVLVREAEFSRDRGEGDMGEMRRASALKLEIDLSHNRDTAQEVTSSDWSLVDEAGTVLKPRPMGKPEEEGTRAIPPGTTEDVKLFFDVADPAGAYVLRFEPAVGGPGALNIAIQ